MNDKLFDYLVATDQLDEFLGMKDEKGNKDMGLFSNDKEKQDLEEEMNNLDLEEWQKEEVREGRHDPWNFEEDDSEDEDDYYHEDDE